MSFISKVQKKYVAASSAESLMHTYHLGKEDADALAKLVEKYHLFPKDVKEIVDMQEGDDEFIGDTFNRWRDDK